MPRMDQAPNKNRLVKLLLLGDGKVGKTHFAGAAAEAGYNILYIDGDVGAQTLSRLPAAAQQRIYLLPAADSILGGQRDCRFIDLMQQFTTNITFKWNDSQARTANIKDVREAVDELWEITPGKMDSNTILVIDSWTSLTESIMLQAAIANSVDIGDATLSEMRPVYQSGGLKATNMLQVIRAMPCHVIVIGHPDEYQHKVAPEGKKVSEVKEKDLVIEYTKMIPKGTSKPAGLQVAKYFTDVAWMAMSPTGTRKLDFRVKASRISGGHFDGFEDTDKYSFANLVRQMGGTVPSGGAPIDSWLKIIPPGEATLPDAKILDGTAKPVGITGIAGLGAKATTPA